MSALFTQTLDDKLQILLIADPTSLSNLVAKKIQKQNKVNIVFITWKEAKEKHFFKEKYWYKVCLLFEHPFDNHVGEAIPDSILNKSVVVMPLTTAVKGDDEGVSEWEKQVGKETSLFEEMVKNIDKSRFIFHRDLASDNLIPGSFLFNQFENQLWIDPGLELAFQNTDEVAEKISTALLRPQRKAKLIEGKNRKSNVFVQKLRDIYEKQQQVRLPIKQLLLKPVPHPVLKKIAANLTIETTTSSTDEIIKTFVRSKRFFSKAPKKNKKKISLIKPPQKKEIVKVWNQLKINKNRDTKNEDAKVADQKPSPTEKTFRSEIDESDKISTLFSSYRKYQKQDHLNQMTKKTKLGFRKVKHRKFLFFGGAGVSIVALSLLFMMSVFLINISRLQTRFLEYVNSRSLPATAQEKRLAELQESSVLINSKLGFLNPLFPISIFSQAHQIVEISKLLSQLSNQATHYSQTVNSLYQVVIGQADGDPFNTLEEAAGEAGEVFKTTSLLKGELKSFSVEKIGSQDKLLLEEYQQDLASQEKSLSQYQRLAPVLPALFGENQQQVYAVVMQNNQELRPTGGFIQAVALLTFNQGKLINVHVEDVYALDQQLRGVIEPPKDLMQLLNEERWFLRDSNWSPDFPQAAEKIQWFIDKSLGVKVDGVVGINIRVVEEIISALDQLEIDEYNEVLTKRNIDERMEFHSEVQLIDTSKNRDYAELVLFELITKLQDLPREKVSPLLSSILEMANNKELLISVFNPDSHSAFDSLGWTGALIKPNCPTVFKAENCVVDEIAQVEANIGVNKANYYLDRQIDHSITLLTDRANHKRVISFKNKAQTSAWPKGSYKAYTRFYLPLNAVVSSIKVNDSQIEDEQIIKSFELGRQVVGIVTETPVKSETKLQLDYSLPYQQLTPFTYVFFDQKQPGARETSPRVYLQHAPNLSPTLIAPQAEVQGDVIVFNPSKDIGHMFVGVSFE